VAKKIAPPKSTPVFRERRSWSGVSGFFQQRPRLARVFMLVAFVLAVALIFPRYGYLGHDYSLGKPWQEEDLIAPFDFAIMKSPRVLNQERQQALAGAYAVFLLNQPQLAENRARLENYFDQAAQINIQALERGPDSIRYRIQRELRNLRPHTNANTLVLVQHQYGGLPALKKRALEIYDRIYQLGYIDRSPDEIQSPMVSLRSTVSQEMVLDKKALISPASLPLLLQQETQNLSAHAAELVRNALAKWAEPNYLFDLHLTQEEQANALRYVSPISGKIEKGRVIIRHGEIVTPTVDRQIRSLYDVKYHKMDFANYLATLLGQIILLSLLAAIMIFFLRINRREIHRRTKRVSMIFFIFFLMVLILSAMNGMSAYISDTYEINLLYLVPLSMAAIMLTVFFDDRVGFLGNILIASMAAIANHNNFEIFFVQFIAGSVAVFNLKFLRKRQQFFLTTGWLLLAYTSAYLAYQIYLKSGFSSVNYQNLVLFVVNAFFTLATYPVIYIFERLFNLSSDLTYMELLDTDHPLLKDLAIKAPGTYQHSLQVANLSEEAAKKIGANALQVHAAALFHDIGKIYQPEYYTENKGSGPSPHTFLEPRQSAQIIISHVTLGETLARDYRLPEEMIDFIRTHHGYSRVEFFYHKYMKDNPEQRGNKVIEREFRYPGPLPTTKEQAIVMIADSCEAAARSLDNPTKEALEEMIERIVNSKINDNQLILAKITFRDLTIIKREILRILSSVYHHRVKYPDQQPAEQPA
jgi:hypothetical protein